MTNEDMGGVREKYSSCKFINKINIKNSMIEEFIYFTLCRKKFKRKL